eukprot:jgi/Mesvir1/28952/Mv17730-RA.1
MSDQLEQRLLESAISVSDGESQEDVEVAEEMHELRAHPAVISSGLLWAILSIGLWSTTFLGDADVWLTGITSSLGLVGAGIFLYGCKASVSFPSFFAPWGKGLPHSPARGFCAALAGSTVLLCTSLALDKVPPILACMRGCEGPQLGEQCGELCAATRARLAVTSYIAALGATAVYCGISAVRSPCMARLFRAEGPPSGDESDESDDSSSDESDFSFNLRRSRRSGLHPMPRMGICCGAFLTDWLATSLSSLAAVLFPLGTGDMEDETSALNPGSSVTGSSGELSQWREEVRSALVLRGWQVRAFLLSRPVLLLSLVTKLLQISATGYALVHSCAQGAAGTIAPSLSLSLDLSALDRDINSDDLSSLPQPARTPSHAASHVHHRWLPGVPLFDGEDCSGVVGADIPRWSWLLVYLVLLVATLPIWAHRWRHRSALPGGTRDLPPQGGRHGHRDGNRTRDHQGDDDEDAEEEGEDGAMMAERNAAALRVQAVEELRVALDTLFLIWTLVGINCHFLDVSWAPGGGSGFGPDPDGWDGDYATWGGHYAAARGRAITGGDSSSNSKDGHGGWVAHTVGLLAWLKQQPLGLASLGGMARDPARVLTLKNVAFAHCLVAWLGVAALPIATFVLWLLVSATVRLFMRSIFYMGLVAPHGLGIPPLSPTRLGLGGRGATSSPRRGGAGGGMAAMGAGGSGANGPALGSGQWRRARDHEMRLGRGSRALGNVMVMAVGSSSQSSQPPHAHRMRAGGAGRVVRVYDQTYARMTAAHAVAAAAAAAAAAQKPDPGVLAAIRDLPVATFQRAGAPEEGGARVRGAGCQQTDGAAPVPGSSGASSGATGVETRVGAPGVGDDVDKAGTGKAAVVGGIVAGKGKGKEVTVGSVADGSGRCGSCGGPWGASSSGGASPVDIVFTDTLAGRAGPRKSQDGVEGVRMGEEGCNDKSVRKGEEGCKDKSGYCAEEEGEASAAGGQVARQDDDSWRGPHEPPAPHPVHHHHHHGDGLENWGGFVGGRFLAPEHSVCALCLDDYVTGDRVKSLACPARHVFHDECISQWLQGGARRVCPLCNLDALATVMPPVRPAPMMAQQGGRGRHHGEGHGRERGREGDRRRHEERRGERHRGRRGGVARSVCEAVYIGNNAVLMSWGSDCL